MDRQPKSALLLIVMGLCCLTLGYIFAAPATDAKESSRARSAGGDAFRAATIDIERLFKDDPKFIQLREQFATQVREAEDAVKSKAEALESRKRLLQKIKPASDNFKRLKAEIEIETALLQDSVQDQKTFYTKREADIYWNCHQDFLSVIETYCEEHGIQLVVRNVKSEVDTTNTQSILQRLNRDVVYDKGIDITDVVLAKLKERPDRRREEPQVAERKKIEPTEENPPADDKQEE